MSAPEPSLLAPEHLLVPHGTPESVSIPAPIQNAGPGLVRSSVLVAEGNRHRAPWMILMMGGVAGDYILGRDEE